jgi:hypothetical protein
MTFIEDGTGTGKRVKVNRYNHLVARSVAEPLLSFASHNGNSFGLGTPLTEISASNYPNNFRKVFWFQNNDPGNFFHVDSFFLNYVLSGSSNAAATMTATWHFNESVPEVSASQGAFVNLNLGKSNVALGDVYYWNGSGSDGFSGQTTTTPGLFKESTGVGRISVELGGAVSLDYGNSVTLSVDVSDDGYFALSVLGYYQGQENTV